MPRPRESTIDLIAREDFVALEQLARGAVREGDRDVLDALRRELLAFVLERWRATPLPRLGELVTILGRHVTGPAGELLAADTRKKLPDEVFETLLHEHDPLLDIDALIAAAARGVSNAIHFRVETLQEVFAERRDPRITSALLRWFEAPPIRAIDSQPMWDTVFEILETQGEPRGLTGLEAMASADFPSGKTMQRWMASRVTDELAKWHARPDLDALRALTAPGAEGDRADALDTLAQLVATLTGEDPVARGGEVLTATVASLLAWTGATAPSTDSTHTTAPDGVPIACVEHDWRQLSSSSDGTRLAVSDGLQLLVVDAEGRLLWQRQAHLEPDHLVRGFALSPSGRWLALQEDGRHLVLVDIDSGLTGLLPLPLPEPRTYSYAPSPVGPEARTLTWSGDERRLYSAHLVETLVTGNVWSGHHLVVETRLELPDTDGILPSVTSVRRIYSRQAPGAPDAPLHRHTSVNHQVDGLCLALSPSERRLLVVSPSPHSYGARQHHVVVLEHTDDDSWRHIAGLELTARLAWLDDARLAVRCRPRNAETTRHVLELSTEYLRAVLEDGAAAEVDAALDGLSSALETHGDAIPTAMVARLACASHADVCAVAPSLTTGDVEVYDTVTGELRVRACAHDAVTALALSPTGEVVVYASKPSAELRGTTADGPHKAVRLRGHKDTIEQLLVTSSTPPRIISMAADAILLWSLDGERLLDLRHRTAPRAMALHPNQRALAVAEADRITLRDLHTGHEVAELEVDAEPRHLSWSPDAASVLWLDGPHLMQWRPADEPSPATVAATHDTSWVALTSQPTRGVAAATDDRGDIYRLTDDGASGLALRRVASGLTPRSALALGPDGDLFVGCGRRLALGSVTRLTIDAEPAPHRPAPAPVVLDSSIPLPPLVAEPDALVRHIDQAAARHGTVANDEIDKLRAALRHTSRRPKGVRQFAEITDPALWAAVLAEAGVFDPQREYPLFELRPARASGWLLALLEHAPADLPLADAWRRQLTRLWTTPRLPLDALRSPHVVWLQVSLASTGRDLRGLPGLETLFLTDLEPTHAAEDVERFLSELQVDDDKRLTLELNPRNLERTPTLHGTPFDRLELNASPQRVALHGLGTLRQLTLRNQSALPHLRDLSTCTRLESLELRMCDAVDSLAGLDEAIDAGAPLQHLTLSVVRALDDLGPLSGATTLETLSLNRAAVTSLHGLEGCTSLRKLELQHCALTDLAGLSDAPLVEVDITLDTLRDASALAASAATLETLRLAGCRELRSVDWLSDATSLRRLDLRGCASLANLPPLDACTQLDTVWLHGTPMTPDDVPRFVRERASWAEYPLDAPEP